MKVFYCDAVLFSMKVGVDIYEDQRLELGK